MKALFLFKEESIETSLDETEIFRGSLRKKVWTGSKLRGDKVTLRELKFKGII